MAPKLSVLMCGVPRRAQAGLPPTLLELLRQAEGESVEVIYLLDNKQRTVGAKRNACLAIAQGDYIAFVDDDDEVAPDYTSALLHAISRSGADLIVFSTRVTINGARDGVVRSSRETATQEEYRPGDITHRRPIQIHCWRRALVKDVKFPDQMYGEDHAWGDAACACVASEFTIDAVLYHYKYDSRVSEAPR